MSEFGTLENLSDSGSDVENVLPPKKPRLFGVYNRVAEFQNLKEATAHIKSTANFNYDTKKQSADGMKHYYRCKVDPKCASKAYLLLAGKSLVICIFICRMKYVNRIFSKYFRFVAESYILRDRFKSRSPG